MLPHGRGVISVERSKLFTGFQKLKLIVVKFAFNSERKFVEIRVRQHELSQKAELY